MNSNLAKSMIHHNQTKEWTTWFLTTVAMGYTLCGARPNRVKVVWPTWAFQPRAKLGNPPIPHRRVARRSNLTDRR
jgi:hypothetical protein